MSVEVADGPLGLEATHHWNAAAILNQRGSLPRVVLDRIGGLHSLPDAEDNREARTAQMGEVTYPSYVRGRTIPHEGRIQAATLQDLRALTNALRGAFGDRNAEGEMTIIPDPAYGSLTWSYRARVLQFDVDEQQARGPGAQPTPWERPVTIGLRMSDPRFYLVGGEGVSGQADGATATVTNQGTAPTDPVFTGAVGIGNLVTLENLDVPTSNGTARLRFNSMPAAGTLTVDFAARSAYVTTVLDEVYDAMTDFDAGYSQWWDELIPGLRPGSNQVVATGPSSWGVSFRSASW